MKTLFKTFIVLAAVLVSTESFAARQSTSNIKGTVISASDNQPVGFATLAVMQMDSTIVTGVACDENGAYSVNNITAGNYILSASMIGYKTTCVNVTVSEPSQQIAPIAIAEDTQMLQSAVITEKVKLVEMKLDKIVVNVSQSAYANGSNALELMKKAPGVTIDKDGNVKLNGKSVAVWIDGRPSYLDGKSLEALLRATNSESIEKFELMDNPSSKYDAAGQGGIINIKTKKNLASGFNGSMGLGGGGMYFGDTDRGLWQQSYWLNLGLRTKKTNTFFSIYEGFYNTDIKLNNYLEMNTIGVDPLTFKQDATSLLANKYHNYNVKIGNDWFIDNKNTLGFIFYMPGDRTEMNTVFSDTKQYMNDALFQNADSDIKNLSKSLQYNANLNYTHIFDETKSSEMTVNLDYYRNGSSARNSQVDETVYTANPDEVYITNKNISTDQKYDIYSAKVDYQSVLWQKVMFESGAKWATSITDNRGDEIETGLPDVKSDFNYREHVGAAYFSMAGQFGEKFSAKFGLRGEYTNSFGDWLSAGTQTKRDYFNVFPTVYLGYMPKENWRLSLTYTRRIQRPNYSQLDPTKTYVDAHTYIVGNPDLLPSFGDNASASVGYGQYLSLTGGYQFMNNMLIQLPSYDEVGTEYLTWGNFGKQHMAFLSFNVSSLPITKWLDWTLSLVGLYTNATSELLESNNSSFGAKGYTEFTFNLPKDWKISLDANYQSPIAYGLYKTKTVFTSDFAVKKNLLDNRMTLSFRVDDLFRTQSNDLEIIGTAGTKSVISQKYYSQKAIFDITWNFGKAQQTRSRKVGNLDEMSRVGAGKQGL